MGVFNLCHAAIQTPKTLVNLMEKSRGGRPDVGAELFGGQTLSFKGLVIRSWLLE